MTFNLYQHILPDVRSVHDPRLLMAREGAIEVRYAPFDYVNLTAKLVILGITPGVQQADAAIMEAGNALRSGSSDTEALARAKVHASFAGPMRTNLVAMLDAIGVNNALGIASCATLWEADVDLVQFASALRYPVLKDGKNYSGSSPRMISSSLLHEHLLEYTGSELASLPQALVLPLGSAVADACRYLRRVGKLQPDRVIEGVPHPSRANGERIAYFLGRKDKSSLSEKTNPDKIDAGRNAALHIVEKWGKMVQLT